jgi:hypothetical protein
MPTLWFPKWILTVGDFKLSDLCMVVVREGASCRDAVQTLLNY